MSQVGQHIASEFSDLRVAIVHDWLTVYGGAERVLAHMLALLPHADVFTLIDFLPYDSRSFLQNARIRTSFLQRLPFARRRYRTYLPLMPLAVEEFDLSGYDVVISSTHAVAKGVITGPDQLHISYVHSPARYAWDLQHEYFTRTGLDRGAKSWIAKWMMHRIRMWDIRTSNGVDHFVANSRFIKRRVWKVYRRDASVIYPPVDINAFGTVESKDDFFLTASRLVPYKRIDLIVEAFRHLPRKRLVVIGDGPELKRIQKAAADNVTVLGYQEAHDLRRYMQHARAFVFAAQEDFGIVPVEAQACGTPVIAYGRGGVAESVRGLDTEEPTGVLFAESTVESLIGAIELFEKNRGRISPTACRENASRFAPERFRTEFAGLLRRNLPALGEPSHPTLDAEPFVERAAGAAAE